MNRLIGLRSATQRVLLQGFGRARYCVSPAKKYSVKSEPSPRPVDRNFKRVAAALLLSSMVYVGYLLTFKSDADDEKFEYKSDLVGEWIDVPNYKDRHFRINGFTLPRLFVKNLGAIKKFRTEASDIWIASYPKSGTTWLQEIVYLVANDCDFEKAQRQTIEQRVPFIEYVEPFGIEYINKMETRPRLIKTHMPLSCLPDDLQKRSKVIYIVRDPKDIVVSYFHFTDLIEHNTYTGSFRDFMEMFKNGQSLYGPWWRHVNEYVDAAPDVLVVSYEDLHKKRFETIKSICKFLGKDLTDEQINSIVEWSSFDKMKENAAVNYAWWPKKGFFRKGKVGDWTNYFSPDEALEFDATIAKHFKLKN